MRTLSPLLLALTLATTLAPAAPTRFEGIAGNYTGFIQASGAAPTDSGLASLDVESTAQFTGFVLIDGFRFSIKGTFGEDPNTFDFEGHIGSFSSSDGGLFFGPRTSYTMIGRLNVAERTVSGSIDVTYFDRRFGSVLVSSTSFVLDGREPDPDVADALKGRRLTALIEPPVTGSTQEIPGDGSTAVTVSKTKRRAIRYVGQLPDAERYSAGGYLHGRTFHLFSILYPPPARVDQDGVTRPPIVPLSGHVSVSAPPRAAGVILGAAEAEVSIDGEPFLSSPVAWNKRPNVSTYYSEGFNVTLPVLAGAYPRLKPSALVPIGIDKQLAGNTVVRLRRGNLLEDIEVTMDLRGRVPKVLKTSGNSDRPNPYDFKMSVNALQGTFSGTFTHPGSGERTSFAGAFRPKTAFSPGEGRGSFRGTVADPNAALPESGSVRVAPLSNGGPVFAYPLGLTF